MRILTRTITPANASANAVCLSQTTAGAGNLLLNGATGGVLDYARVLSVASGGNDSGVNFTFTGTDQDGNAVTETIAGPNGNTVVTTNFYLTVTSIAVNGAVTQAVTVGTSNTTALRDRTIGLNIYNRVAPTVTVEVTGTANYTESVCFDSILDNGTSKAVFENITTLTAQTGTNTAGAYINSAGGATGLRTTLNTYTNGAKLVVIITHSAQN